MVEPGELSGDALADAADRLLAAEELVSAVVMYHRAEPWVGDPDRCAGGRWMAHMLGGDYVSAWRESDAIRRRGRPDPHRFWLGEALRGKRLMLRSLHGFGDAVMMFRFLPRLRKLAAGLVVEVPPRMVELAACFPGAEKVVTWGEGAPVVAPVWDVQMEVMEVPYALRVSSGDLEPRLGYLRLPVAARARAAEVVGRRGKPRVGVVWSAGEWNRVRSVPFEVFRGLLEVEGVETLRHRMLPLVDWVTPNVAELRTLCGEDLRADATRAQILEAARGLREAYAGLTVLVTGGDLEPPDDLLICGKASGAEADPMWLAGERVETTSTHGTGCAFSSALLCRLALGDAPAVAACAAKRYVARALRHATPLGGGRGPMNLLWPLLERFPMR